MNESQVIADIFKTHPSAEVTIIRATDPVEHFRVTVRPDHKAPAHAFTGAAMTRVSALRKAFDQTNHKPIVRKTRQPREVKPGKFPEQIDVVLPSYVETIEAPAHPDTLAVQMPDGSEVPGVYVEAPEVEDIPWSDIVAHSTDGA